MSVDSIVDRIMHLPDDDRCLLLKVFDWLVSVVECRRLAEIQRSAEERPSDR